MSDDSRQSRRPGREKGEFGVLAEPGTLRLERLLPGPIERVWDYLTQPEQRRKWLAPGVMELRMGGSVQLQFHLADLSADPALPKDHNDCEVSGTVTGCEPPRLLRFTWNDSHGDLSEVTFELSPKGQDVILVLTHRRLDERAHLIGVATGWHTHLSILVDRLNGMEPRPFWLTRVQLEAEYEKRITS